MNFVRVSLARYIEIIIFLVNSQCGFPNLVIWQVIFFESIGLTTASLRSCEYSKKDGSFNDKIHYITMILYLTFTINKKTVLST